MPSALLLYHFFDPDSVVSSRHFTQLAESLAERGWAVEAWPSNRLRHDSRATLPAKGRVGRVTIRRCWRPPLPQDRILGRLVNTAAMFVHWVLRAGVGAAPDVVVIGTDPPMSVVLSRAWRFACPRTRVVHWCFDLYPAAAVAHGVLRRDSLAERWLRTMAGWGLRGCHAIADLGPCMRDRIEELAPGVPKETLVPWALAESVEPERPDPILRRSLFGDARSVLLYAGRLGRAYEYKRFIDLARSLRTEDVIVAFQGTGEREREIRAAGKDLPNLRFLPPCPAAELGKRLQAADFHLVSLRAGWSGVVVPSKFFAALAAGRPVIYDGPAESSVARWITELDLGLVLSHSDTASDAPRTRAAITRLEREPEWGRHCWTVGRERFSRDAVTRDWQQLLERQIRLRDDR